MKRRRDPAQRAIDWQAELGIIAAALAILLAGALIGAAWALIARAHGTPTTSAAIFIDRTDQPVAP